ncbi:hypothetical protein [Pectobacterium carotovorum]|uniref:Uncharacterized protein n=1 Tax=Pectobacterium carotovorum subsp. carotovorum TaxID=555 RepID=A0AAI9PF72_PECCC|nr:hypothetical protein [Pectobacterium carotovorum]GKX47729.1 hypothetical protein SOASR016_24810 [Pectobacterium carotovorum subsp. carotovorum]GLV70173.1 hypothetical protein Pcaca03_26170 [Pectobacterium carotovorum subsp. carotovorum]
MKFEIYDDSLIVGRYAFTNVEYLYDVIDGVYDLRFDVIGVKWNTKFGHLNRGDIIAS